MKLGILTFHRAHNYGAMLQAFALRRTLTKLGHSVEFISYRQPKIEEAYKNRIWRFDKRKSFVINLKDFVANILMYSRRLRRRKAFQSFARIYLPESKKYSKKDLQREELQYDAVVFGSDQIWTTRFLVDFDNIYWGDINLKGGRKIAYAPSMELKEINESQKRFIQTHLANFDAISARELSMCDMLSELTQGTITNVLDPTLLCRAEDYYPLIKHSKAIPNFKYILLYQVGNKPIVREIAKKVSFILGYPIIEIGSKVELFSPKGYIETYGPDDFVTLFTHANFVVSYSFHGTAFSVIFEKPFLSILIPGLDARVTSFLSNLDLMERGVKTLSDVSESLVLNEIDYIRANTRLEELRKKSLCYIENALK